jgi:hypothetical protein
VAEGVQLGVMDGVWVRVGLFRGVVVCERPKVGVNVKVAVIVLVRVMVDVKVSVGEDVKVSDMDEGVLCFFGVFVGVKN